MRDEEFIKEEENFNKYVNQQRNDDGNDRMRKSLINNLPGKYSGFKARNYRL